MQQATIMRRLVAELTGSAILLATVVGSGIMAESLSGGNVALALLANAIATGAILFVLITVFGPVSGAHFNPAVTFSMSLAGDIGRRDAILYMVVQVAGAVAGVWLAHAMFGLPLFQFSTKLRAGGGQWISEAVATSGLILTIYGTLSARRDAVPATVALYITSAYWFTASTSFANPAVTLARMLSDTFAGIRPQDAPIFVGVQLASALASTLFARWLFGKAVERRAL